jgi:hypothetical protein
LPFADVPPSAALGAHLDHRTSLAPATMRAVPCGPLRSGAIQPRAGDDAGRAVRPAEKRRNPHV